MCTVFFRRSGSYVFPLFPATAHECYVCVGQAGNGGKCTETVGLCEYEEQSCMTTVSWGSKYGQSDFVRSII